MTGRIRWIDSPDTSITAFIGWVGTIEVSQLAIYRPGHGSDDEYTLTSTLPGLDHMCVHGDDPEQLKDEAERRLARFVSSLGASFTEPLTDSQCFQVSEARDMLALWSQNRDFAGNISTERVLADVARNLLAIIDQAFPAPATAGETDGT